MNIFPSETLFYLKECFSSYRFYPNYHIQIVTRLHTKHLTIYLFVLRRPPGGSRSPDISKLFKKSVEILAELCGLLHIRQVCGFTDYHERTPSAT